MSNTDINVLMTGAGAPGAAGILQCIWQEPAFKVTVADANPHALGRYLTDEFITIPPANEDSFISSLLARCREKNIHIILPLVTKELIPLATHRNEFELAGCKILVSDVSSLEIANNKSKLYEFLQWRGINVPGFRIVETVDQFKAAITELGFPGRPVCFKPSISNGSRGFRILDKSMNEHSLLFHEKPTAAYMRYDDAVRILSSTEFPQLLVSEYLSGDEFSVDCLAKQGDCLAIVPRLRKKMINGISVEGEFINDLALINYCRRIINELQLHGNIGIQIKKSSSGEWMILEINPRVQGTISAALGAGINLPVLAIKQELGFPILPEELEIKWGTKFSRYWREVFY